ncbi:unnamed protein product [Heligmosomoides polygyrus]|uniref:Uncharacterized protein n=1 Tax=Heligmosomoides polygyrus TaxID=6339 RepID=A0A183GQE2_HELPZ|nr:unnamed protein product [Heligmosomoides polygyrus]
MVDDNPELAALRSNADSLGKCLHALLERIETLEGRSGRKPVEVSENEHDDDRDRRTKKDEQVEIHDSVSVDPNTGVKKRTIVTERVLTTKTFHALSLDPSPSIAPISNGRILSPGYQARAVHIDAKQLNQVCALLSFPIAFSSLAVRAKALYLFPFLLCHARCWPQPFMSSCSRMFNGRLHRF